MKKALDQAGFSFQEISYINLHGTGTKDNDLVGKRILLWGLGSFITARGFCRSL
jgi:3-oxoacyl-(acyl-carrier-protein) synthase